MVLPKLLRRVAVLTTASAIGIALLAPLAAQSARQPGAEVPSFLLDAAPATSTIDRGAPGRERLALLTLYERTRAVPPETLSSELRALPTPGSAEMQATIMVEPAAQPAAKPPAPTAAPPPPPPTGDTITGPATWYCCTAGWGGEAVVALPGALGGQYDPPPAARSVTICADRCATLPVVDYCDCYWGTSSQRVADLSPEAWALISDASTAAGVIRVTVELD
jgi:hypothetical protein